jgi:hypothetical protein
VYTAVQRPRTSNAPSVEENFQNAFKLGFNHQEVTIGEVSRLDTGCIDQFRTLGVECCDSRCILFVEISAYFFHFRP